MHLVWHLDAFEEKSVFLCILTITPSPHTLLTVSLRDTDDTTHLLLD